MPRKAATKVVVAIPPDMDTLDYDVAQRLALGWNPNAIARDLEITNKSTIYEMCKSEKIRNLATELRPQIMKSMTPLLQNMLVTAQALVFKALIGEIAADAPRVLMAERILSATLWRTLKLNSPAPEEASE